MNVTLVMFKDGKRREFPLTEKETVLGRRQDCTLRIPTKDISRRHCAILVNHDRLVARDLGSSNGTYVNGKRIAEAELAAGDRLRVGPVVFMVQIDGKPEKIRPEDLVVPLAAGGEPDLSAEDDAETFELSEDDFDLDDAISALDDEDDDDDV